MVKKVELVTLKKTFFLIAKKGAKFLVLRRVLQVDCQTFYDHQHLESNVQHMTRALNDFGQLRCILFSMEYGPKLSNELLQRQLRQGNQKRERERLTN